MRKEYLTAIEALNYHHYDWHKGSVNYNRKYPDELKSWCSWGIKDNIANPIRAYLDYLYYNIKFLKRVPNIKIDMLLFDEKEEQEIKEKIETLLKPKLSNSEELELLGLYKEYLNGGEYNFKSKLLNERLAYRRYLKEINFIPKKPLKKYLKEIDIKKADFVKIALMYENVMPESEIFEILSSIYNKNI